MTDLRCAHCARCRHTIEWFMRFGIFHPSIPSLVAVVIFFGLWCSFPVERIFDCRSPRVHAFRLRTTVVTAFTDLPATWVSTRYERLQFGKKKGNRRPCGRVDNVAERAPPDVDLRIPSGRVLSRFIVTASPLKHVKLLPLDRLRLS